MPDDDLLPRTCTIATLIAQLQGLPPQQLTLPLLWYEVRSEKYYFHLREKTGMLLSEFLQHLLDMPPAQYDFDYWVPVRPPNGELGGIVGVRTVPVTGTERAVIVLLDTGNDLSLGVPMIGITG